MVQSSGWACNPLGFHDRDIALDYHFMEHLFRVLPSNYETLRTNQYIGITHTQIESSFDGNAIQFIFTQDSHYCAYFADHPSSWRLWLSDWLWQQFGALHLELSVDHEPANISKADFDHEALTIDLPPRSGLHIWMLGRQRTSRNSDGNSPEGWKEGGKGRY